MYCTIVKIQLFYFLFGFSPYLGKYNIFVCTTLLPEVRLNFVYFRKQRIKVAHVQKYAGFGDIENPGRTLDVTLGSSTDTNLGHNHILKKIKKCMVEFLVFSNRIFSGSSWLLIVFNTIFTYQYI